MQRRRRRLTWAAVLVLLASAGGSASLARETDKQWELGGYAIVTNHSGSSHIELATGLGARGAYHFRAANAVEFEIDNTSAGHELSDDIDFDILKYGVAYVRTFLPKARENLSPFLTFGLGQLTIDDGELDRTSSFLAFGGGLKHWFTPRVGIRFGTKFYRWRGDGKVGFRPLIPGPAVEGVPREPFFTLDVTVGITFLVGQGATVKTPAPPSS